MPVGNDDDVDFVDVRVGEQLVDLGRIDQRAIARDQQSAIAAELGRAREARDRRRRLALLDQVGHQRRSPPEGEVLESRLTGYDQDLLELVRSSSAARTSENMADASAARAPTPSWPLRSAWRARGA